MKRHVISERLHLFSSRSSSESAPPPAFSPDDLSGLSLWLKNNVGLYEDAAKTDPVDSDGDLIYVWEDQSGNGNDAVQVTSASRPEHKTSILNSLPVARFDGTDDNLAIPDSASLSPTTISIFFVFKRTSSQAFDGMVTKVSPAFQVDYGVSRFSSNSDFGFYSNATTNRHEFSPTTFDSAFKTCSSIYDKVNLSVYLNGSLDGSTAYTVDIADGTNDLNIGSLTGAAGFVNGDFAEVIIYDHNLNSTDRGNVESYLQTKFAHY